MRLLDEGEIAAELASAPGWTRRGNAIEKTYRFSDFKGAMLFVNGVAALAEAARHHPDVALHDTAVGLSLWTHSAGGLTTKDFALARRIDAGARAMSAPEPLPEVFQARFAALDEQRYTTRAPDLFHRCFGCGPGHPTGLRVRCFKVDGGVLAPIIVSRQYEGPPDGAHGGIVAAYLDEVLAGAVVTGTGRVAITGELTVRYVRPVPLETPLVGGGRVLADHGRYVDAEGRIEDLATGEVFATARGRFFPLGGAEVRRA